MDKLSLEEFGNLILLSAAIERSKGTSKEKMIALAQASRDKALKNYGDREKAQKAHEYALKIINEVYAEDSGKVH